MNNFFVPKLHPLLFVHATTLTFFRVFHDEFRSLPVAFYIESQRIRQIQHQLLTQLRTRRRKLHLFYKEKLR